MKIIVSIGILFIYLAATNSLPGSIESLLGLIAFLAVIAFLLLFGHFGMK